MAGRYNNGCLLRAKYMVRAKYMAPLVSGEGSSDAIFGIWFIWPVGIWPVRISLENAV
jgi:hypothetical protein